MRPFDHIPAASPSEATSLHGGEASTHYLAGGTTQLDLMKLNVLQPNKVVDIRALRVHDDALADHGEWLHLSGFATMRAAAESAVLRRAAPVVTDSLLLAASTQIRTMATLGGNLLQRTRCGYFRDTSWACNRREPGSGCAAITGTAWAHAVLGTSTQCIAIYPGDFAQALVALEAVLEIEGVNGVRLLPVAELHRLPGDTPHHETSLAAGDLITGIRIPKRPWFNRSRYVKVRDRASYEFALASAAVALDFADDRVRDARIAIGGVATVPWRSREAEAALIGKPITEATARASAKEAFAATQIRPDTAARARVGVATVQRALLEVAQMEVEHG